MSETFRELRGITPTFQSVLNHNLLALTDSLNMGDFRNSYTRLKTLILLLNPKDKAEFMDNDVAHIEALLSEANKLRGVDLRQTGLKINRAKDRVLRVHILGLFDRVMTRLHEGGYLEKIKEIRKGKFGVK